MTGVFQLLDSIAPLSKDLRIHLTCILKTQRFEKRTWLLRAGRTCTHIWFIDKGLVGSFYEKNDKTLCTWFMKEKDVVISVCSFFGQVPSNEYIIALDDTVVQYITYQELQGIYSCYPEFNVHGRLLAQQYYIRAEERMRAFHQQSPLEKYRYILAHFPELVLRVSATHLARYMGITLETLSRVKGKVAAEHRNDKKYRI